MIKAFRDYLLDYEKLEVDAKLNVEYLPAGPVHYTIVEDPLIDIGKGVGVVNHYHNGSKVKEFRVRLLRSANYDEPTAVNIANSQFLKHFEKWIEDNNKNKIYPNIDGILSIETTTNGYIESVANDQSHAVYTVGLRITYLER